jgi:hypothetical protein
MILGLQGQTRTRTNTNTDKNEQGQNSVFISKSEPPSTDYQRLTRRDSQEGELAISKEVVVQVFRVVLRLGTPEFADDGRERPGLFTE